MYTYVKKLAAVMAVTFCFTAFLPSITYAGMSGGSKTSTSVSSSRSSTSTSTSKPSGGMSGTSKVSSSSSTQSKTSQPSGGMSGTNYSGSQKSSSSTPAASSSSTPSTSSSQPSSVNNHYYSSGSSTGLGFFSGMFVGHMLTSPGHTTVVNGGQGTYQQPSGPLSWIGWILSWIIFLAFIAGLVYLGVYVYKKYIKK